MLPKLKKYIDFRYVYGTCIWLEMKFILLPFKSCQRDMFHLFLQSILLCNVVIISFLRGWKKNERQEHFFMRRALEKHLLSANIIPYSLQSKGNHIGSSSSCTCSLLFSLFKWWSKLHHTRFQFTSELAINKHLPLVWKYI